MIPRRQSDILYYLITDFITYMELLGDEPVSASCLDTSTKLLKSFKSLIDKDDDLDWILNWYQHLNHFGFVAYLTACEPKVNRWDCKVELGAAA